MNDWRTVDRSVLERAAYILGRSSAAAHVLEAGKAYDDPVFIESPDHSLFVMPRSVLESILSSEPAP